MAKYCVHCGNELKAESKFCDSCGKMVELKKEEFNMNELNRKVKRERPMPSRREVEEIAKK